MNWLEKMNDALDYVEENLTLDIDYSQVAMRAGCSVYYFQRMFSFVLDIPLSEYIRRRRLTQAAYDIQNTNERILDIALKYGYESPDSFRRAFHNMHGITPSVARGEGVQMKAFPRLSFQISIKGDVAMNYRIEERKEFGVFGKSITIGVNENSYERIPKLWDEILKDGTYEAICDAAGIKPYGEVLLNAVLYDFDEESYKNKYMIHTGIPEGGTVSEKFEKLTIPKSRWIIFSEKYEKVEGTTEVMQGLWKRIFTEWLPTTSYEIVSGPQLEVYPNGEKCVEVWIPIK